MSAGVPGTYRLSTAGVVTVASGTGAAQGGTTAAGSITISGSSTQSINISEGGHTPNGGANLANIKCAYDGGAPQVCNMSGVAPPGAGKILLIGADAVVNGTQSDGASSSPSFTITVLYQ